MRYSPESSGLRTWRRAKLSMWRLAFGFWLCALGFGQGCEEKRLPPPVLSSSFVQMLGKVNETDLRLVMMNVHSIVRSAEKCDKPLEGFIASSPLQTALYLKVGATTWVHQVCETGFNGGHSALSMLFGSRTSKLVSFE